MLQFLKRRNEKRQEAKELWPLSKNCKTSFLLDGKQLIGQGRQGMVFRSCEKRDPSKCTTVTKVAHVDPDYPQKAQKALWLQQQAALAGIAPKVLEAVICKKPKELFLGKKLPEELDKNLAVQAHYGFAPLFITMEVASGKPLQEIKDKDSELCEATQAALKKLNALDIFHGDVHPENLLYDDDKKQMTIIDFNMARRISECSSNHHIRRALAFEQLYEGAVSSRCAKEIINELESQMNRAYSSSF